MTHPLTDEMIQSIWDKVGNDIVNAKDEDLVEILDPWDNLMRTAYDKGAADRLEQVIEWLDAIIFENFFEDSLWSEDLACVPRRLREAMRPQEES